MNIVERKYKVAVKTEIEDTLAFNTVCNEDKTASNEGMTQYSGAMTVSE